MPPGSPRTGCGRRRSAGSALRRTDQPRRRLVTPYLVAQDLVAKGGPLKRMPDALGDVVLSPPAQQALGPADSGVGAGDVARPPGSLACLDRVVRDLVERGKELPDCGAGAATEVDSGHRSGQGVEPGQRGDVRRG